MNKYEQGLEPTEGDGSKYQGVMIRIKFTKPSRSSRRSVTNVVCVIDLFQS